MKRIRKRIVAAALAAVVLITMPGTASYALEENGQTEYISDIGTEPEEANVTEEPKTETDNIEKPETGDSGTEEPETEAGDTEEKDTDTEETTEEEPDSISQEDTAECICDTLCAEDSNNENCPVCAAEGADFSDCKGEKMEGDSIETPKRTEESGAEEKIITAWEWIDPEEYLTDGMLALPGAGSRNPAFLADVTDLLPEKIQAEVATVNVTEDGEEAETLSEALSEAEEMDITLTGWKCVGYPENGAYEGVYTFYASLPEGFVLAEDAVALKVKVELGGAKMLDGEVSAAYQEASWNGSAVTYTNKSADCTPVTDSAEAVTWNAGWYVVNSTVTISQPITVSGDVNLILADDCTLNVEQGSVVTNGNSLTIYAQTDGSGKLNATGIYDTSGLYPVAGAGIGGGTTSSTVNSGTITIHGGIIHATGGNSDDERSGVSAAGIGGGSTSNDGGSSGTIVIYGGTVTADSGLAQRTGAGIGGGFGGSNSGVGSNITIYGGDVTATSSAGATSGAGIGGGAGQLTSGAGSNIKIYGGTVTATSSSGTVFGAGIGGGACDGSNGGAGSNITISGGCVTATGGIRGAGIGGGGSNSINKESGAGTGITISGGEVTAVGGASAAGIGGGGGRSSTYAPITGGTGTNIRISGGIVDAKSSTSGDPIGNGVNASGEAGVTRAAGIIFENGEGTVYGTVALDGEYTVKDGYTLTFAEGGQFDGNYAFYKDGTPIELAVVKADGITGPATVKECEHDSKDVTQYLHNEGTQTHTPTCLACGYTNEAEDCDYDEEYEYDDTSHTQTCTLCGGTKTETHSWSFQKEENGNVTTNYQECSYCGHTKDHVTVTVIAPTGLTYGQTEGKKLTYTVSPEKECDEVMWELAGKNEGWYEVADGALPDILTAGVYSCQVKGSMSDGTYVFQAYASFTVAPAPLTPGIDTGGSTPTKTYDGTTTVPSDGLGIKLEGIVGDDDVTAAAASYEYDSADAGARTIIAGGITLSGDDAGNYKLSDDTARIDGTIDKAAGTLTVPEMLFSKKYGEADFSLQCSTNGDGEISYVSDNKNVATVSSDGMVQIKGIGEARVTVSLAEGRNYTAAAARTVTIAVDMGEIPEGLWISGLTRSVPYTGSAVKPEGISVYHGDTLLREKTEYTISYKNNTNAGTAQLIVTGKGNYKGKCTAEFTIEPVDLTADSGISATIATVTETGKNLKPTVTVTWNGKKLKEKKDYTLSYETGIKTASEEGYAVTITGKGNYAGSIERRFYVKPRGTKLLNSAKVTGIKKSYEYQCSEMNNGNGDAQGQDANPTEQNALPKGLEADLEKITVKIGKVTLTKDDYTVRTESTAAVGTGYVVIEPTQTSDYAGEKRISFNITGTNIKKCYITGLAKSYPYTGNQIMPEIQVYTGKNGTGTQIPSDAYTVSYSNYTNQGKATVTVIGIPEKGCSGSVKATYSIGRLNLATEKETGIIMVTMPNDIKYAKGGAKPHPVVIHSDNGVIRILREGVDYTLKYSNNTAKYSTPSGSTSTGSTKIPTLKITGIGNYTGTITEKFDIGAQEISKLEITVADKAYNSKKKGSYYYSVPKVYDFDGKLLKSGKDYTVQYTNEATGLSIGKTDTVENGTQIRVTVTAKENSNYEGILSRTYLVRDAKDVKDISKVKNDKIAAQQYTGSSIEPEVKLYTLTGKTKNYLTEEDYEIIGYYNNIKRGTATVLIRGTGAYSGVKSITFKITSADNQMIWIGIF